jgi:2'-hydroxyisoflavone reductase
MTTTRRGFLQTAAITAAGIGMGGLPGEAATETDTGTAPTRGGLRMLIMGGTGFFGPAVVEEAVRRGHSMTLFNRGKTNPHLFPDLEKLKGDRNTGDLEALRGRAFDVIIDTSGYVPSHVEAVASMMADSARQYVFFSTCGVYADHSVPADESSPVAEADPEWVASVKTIRESLANYGAMKALCEQTAERILPGRVTNIRPGLIIGPMDRSDRFTYWAVRVAQGGEVLAPGDGLDPVQLVDARDLATWTLECIEKEIFGTYNGISPAGEWTMAGMLYGIKGAFTTDAAFTWVDADFLESAEVAAWTNLPVWIPRVGENGAFHLVSSAKAVAAGLKFRPLADTARDTVAWHVETRGDDYQFGERAGISSEREAELLESWHGREKTPESAGTTSDPS